MIISETKTCPRCKAPFECRAASATQCSCANIELSQATREFLTKTEYDCLCNTCLSALNDIVNASEQHSLPDGGRELIEHVHYYHENGQWVFTEFYHVLRGYCCRNRCKHCAYGYRG